MNKKTIPTMAAIACFAVVFASADVLFTDTFDYPDTSDFIVDGGWTTVNGTDIGVTPSEKLWGNNASLEYNHATALTAADAGLVLAVDATIDRSGSVYPYFATITLWDGSDAGTKVEVATDAGNWSGGAGTRLTYTILAADIGKEIIFEYGHGAGWGETDDVTFRIIPPLPPVWDDPIVVSEGIANAYYEGETLAGQASDPNGDAITYARTGGPAWLIVDTNGDLTGTPLTANLGTNTFTVTATDGTSTPVPAELKIFIRTTLPPVWDEPVAGRNALLGGTYSDTLAGKATDPDGEEILYSKGLGGSAWLVVDIDGALSGTPDVLGTNVFTVIADDGNDTPTSTELKIFVYEMVPGDSTAIGVNFTGSENREIAPDAEAGLPPYIYANWNNAAGNTGGKAGLIDSDGNTTTASVGWEGNNTWQDSNAASDADAGVGDAQVARGYIDDGISPALSAAWSVTNIPYATYNVVIYLSTDTDGDTYLPFIVNGVSNSVASSPKHRYQNPNWDGSNTIVVEGLTDSILTVSGFNRAGSTRGSVAGFQIVSADSGTGSQVTDLAIAGPVVGGMVLTWTGEDGKSYGVETNSNLIIGDWQAFASGQMGDGGTITMTNPVGPNQTFYRVISE